MPGIAAEGYRARAAMHATLIVNPISGRGRAGKAADALRRGLESHGFTVDALATRRKGEAREFAAGLDGRASLVVGVGGDGTLNEIVNGMPDRSVPLGILPTGTSNVLSLDLDLPRRVGRALSSLVAGRTAPIDLARVNGRLSFLCLGVGFDAMVLGELEARRRGAITKWTYVPAIARALARYRAPRLGVEVDGERFDGIAAALVSNTVHYAGRFFGLDPNRRMDDGLFECYLFRGSSRLALVRHSLRAMARRLPHAPGVEFRRARRVRVEADEPVPYQVDGDLAGTTPVELEVLSRELRVVVP